jgi:hypothetical protein
MRTSSTGPSSIAFGVCLADPIILRHANRLILLAREAAVDCNSLYYIVFDEEQAVDAADVHAWNGWYRFDFDLGVSTAVVGNVAFEEQLPPPELRVGGMDLITLPATAQPVAAGDFAFRALSDGSAISVFRVSKRRSLFVNRLMLIERKEEVDGETVRRFELQTSWETRFKYSGRKDMPATDVDTLAYQGATGQPFLEPTLELPGIDPGAAGLFDVIEVPTANADLRAMFIAVNAGNNFTLHRIERHADGFLDFSADTASLTPIIPLMQPDNSEMTPVATLAPALGFYGEQDPARNASGELAELQRLGRLVLAMPVIGGNLNSAMAIFDYTLGPGGNIIDLAAADQTAPLVDGTVSGTTFTPDTSSPVFPTPANIDAATTARVSKMVLGQVVPQPFAPPEKQVSPTLYMGDDGLMHLYYGGPPPAVIDGFWDNLSPNLPQAMVAQYDTRVTRLVLSAPWMLTRPSEEPSSGNVYFNALIGGAAMRGATVKLKVSFGGKHTDLRDVVVTYPRTVELVDETWVGVPADVRQFADILNGDATDDPADPEAKSGRRAFFDYHGTRTLSRVPVTAQSGERGVLQFVSALPDAELQSVVVAGSESVRSYTLTFKTKGNTPISVKWDAVPATIDAYGDIFEGIAGPTAYGYPADALATSIWALATDGLQNYVPVLFVAKNPTLDLSEMAISVAAGGRAGTVTVTITGIKGGHNGHNSTVTASDIAADVAGFKKALNKVQEFIALQLEILTTGASGDVLPTDAAQQRLTLAETAVLVEVLLPPVNLALFTAGCGTFEAVQQSHAPHGHTQQMRQDTPHGLNPEMAGFVVSYDAPSAGIVAEVTAGSTKPGANRTVHQCCGSSARTGVPDLHGAVWVRQTPPKQCGFTGSDNVIVPVVSGDDDTPIPASVNLQARPRWTLETWFKPLGSQQQQVVTFHHTTMPHQPHTTAPPPGAPNGNYALGVKGQQVITIASYAKFDGTDSSYFNTSVSPNASFYPNGEFTWECWIQPLATPAPAAPAGSKMPPLGVVFQYGPAPAKAQFAVGLDSGRHLWVQTRDDMNDPVGQATAGRIPVDSSNNPLWSHIALIGRDQGTAGWAVDVVLNGQCFGTFDGLHIAATSRPPTMQIGGYSLHNTTMFGKIAQLRLWGFARSLPEIRRTRLITLTGREFGLLGSWPMGALVPDSSDQDPSKENLRPAVKVQNHAIASGHLWDAVLFRSSKQSVTQTEDSFFLSVLATVGGAPAIEAPALLRNEAWNHVALSYVAGGALDMNPASRIADGSFDWMEIEHSQTLDQSQNFAIDAWVIVPSTTNLPGALMSRWSDGDDTDDQGFRLIVNRDGTLTFEVVYISDRQGTTKKAHCTSNLKVKDDQPHHIAAVFASTAQTPRQSGNPTDAEFTLTIWVDDSSECPKRIPVAEVATIQVNNPETPIYVGRDIPIAQGATPVADESTLYFQGVLGRLRLWSIAPSRQALFPERYPRAPRIGAPKGLVADWQFTEQAGRIAKDGVGDANGKLSTTAMWRLFTETSQLQVIANGAVVGAAHPFSGTFTSGTSNQFALGAPGATVTGINGDIAQVALYDDLREIGMIEAQKNVPRTGAERGLTALWDFRKGGKDMTGGGNNPSPAISESRISDADAPITNEGASVRNTYGGETTNGSMSAPGRIAVGNYFDVSGAGTDNQQAVLKRQFVMEPGQSFVSPVQIGELGLIFVGQVQTDPTLVGYIEGAPPVPSKNLTRPYYEVPTGAPYTKYLDTSMVTLKQSSATDISYTSQSGSATHIDFGGAAGILLASETDVSSGIGFEMQNNYFTFENKVQAKFEFSAQIGDSTNTGFSGSWGSEQSFSMGLSGDWESNPMLNPTVGRRFLADNLGYAQVESLTGDLYSVVFQASGASLGTIVLPNPDIPPDANIILFPMKVCDYTKATTLDGKVGLMNDPAYSKADTERNSYFKPVEAYETENRIELQKQLALAYAAAFDATAQGRRGKDDLSEPMGKLAATPDSKTDDQTATSLGLPALLPAQGIVNKSVWTADGGIYTEQRNYGARASKAFTGFRQVGGGAGITAGGAFLFTIIGVAWNFDMLASHTVRVEVGKSLETALGLSLDVAVEGEAFLKAWNEKSKTYSPQAAAGKVKAYRFSTFYLPPSVKNGAHFDSIVDGDWKRLSNDPMARALRDLSIVNPVWRVFHRTTYVERIPPIAASGPNFAPPALLAPPVNIAGNLDLCRLVDAELKRLGGHYDRLNVAAAISAVMNPIATCPGTYPASILKAHIPWWDEFLTSARPGAHHDAANAATLFALQSAAVDYMYAGFVTGTIQAALKHDRLPA